MACQTSANPRQGACNTWPLQGVRNTAPGPKSATTPLCGTHTYRCMYIYTLMYVSMYVYSAFVYMEICTHACLYIKIYIYVYICECIHEFVNIHTHVHISMHTYVYIYICISVWFIYIYVNTSVDINIVCLNFQCAYCNYWCQL